jgi:hypothetical protein
MAREVEMDMAKLEGEKEVWMLDTAFGVQVLSLSFKEFKN